MTASRMNSPHTAIAGPSSSIVAQVRGYLGTSLEILRAVVDVVAVELDAVNEAHGLAALVAGRKDLRLDTFGTPPIADSVPALHGIPLECDALQIAEIPRLIVLSLDVMPDVAQQPRIEHARAH